jgi:hypothetical protein
VRTENQSVIFSGAGRSLTLDTPVVYDVTALTRLTVLSFILGGALHNARIECFALNVVAVGNLLFA